MELSFATMVECFFSGIQYLPVTIVLAVIPAVIGIFFGLIFTMLYIYRVPFFGKFFQILIFMISGIPIVVLMLIIHVVYLVKFNDIMAVFHIPLTLAQVPDVWIGVLVLAVDCTNHMSQTIKGAFLSIERGQFEAGYSVGMTRFQTMIRIIIPQGMLVATPGLLNDFITEFKMTSLVMCVGIVDMFSGTLLPCNISYRYFEGYLTVSLMYWAIVAIFEICVRKYENRQSRYRRAAQ